MTGDFKNLKKLVLQNLQNFGDHFFRFIKLDSIEILKLDTIENIKGTNWLQLHNLKQFFLSECINFTGEIFVTHSFPILQSLKIKGKNNLDLSTPWNFFPSLFLIEININSNLTNSSSQIPINFFLKLPFDDRKVEAFKNKWFDNLKLNGRF